MADALADNDWDGDRDNWPGQLDLSSWQPLTVDRRQCAGRRCRHFNSCPFFQAREQLEEADCIVANHDLVLADLALGGGAILPPPEDTLYVFDESHRLAETTLSHFAANCRLETSAQRFARITQVLPKQRQLFEVDDLAVDAMDKAVSAAQSAQESLALAVPMCRNLLDSSIGSGEKTVTL